MTEDQVRDRLSTEREREDRLGMQYWPSSSVRLENSRDALV